MSTDEKIFSPGPLIKEFLHAYKTDKSRLIIVALAFVLLTILTLFGFGVFKGLDLLGEGQCQLTDVPQSNEMQTIFYDFLMRHRFSSSKPRYVAMVTISEDNEPLSVITNTCASRRFLTALIPQLDSYDIKAIAVDQSFTKGSCPEEDTYTDRDSGMSVKTNDQLRQAFELAKHPIIVGWGTHKREVDGDKDDCLMLNDHFEFNPRRSGVSTFAKENVFYGLIRLNNNNLKIPLRWWAFPYNPRPQNSQDVAEPKNSFSLETAEHVPTFSVTSDKVLARDIANDEHPYASFVRDMTKWSAMDVLCYGPDKVAKNGVWGGCDRIAHKPLDDLSGKVVVVGSEIVSDSKPFLDGKRSGAELHADYIEALLTGRYVRTAPEWLDIGAVVTFVIFMLFFQFLAVRKLPAYKGLRDDTALWFTCVVFVTLALAGLLLLELQNWFFPMFFLSCFPIFVSLLGLALYQVQTILTKKHRARRKY